jgi:hypothetical protein
MKRNQALLTSLFNEFKIPLFILKTNEINYFKNDQHERYLDWERMYFKCFNRHLNMTCGDIALLEGKFRNWELCPDVKPE